MGGKMYDDDFFYEDDDISFENVRVLIPEDIEETNEDPLAWWVDDTIGIMQESCKGETFSLKDAVIVIMLLAENENALRKTGDHPGKVSPINWGARLQNLVEGDK